MYAKHNQFPEDNRTCPHCGAIKKEPKEKNPKGTTPYEKESSPKHYEYKRKDDPNEGYGGVKPKKPKGPKPGLTPMGAKEKDKSSHQEHTRAMSGDSTKYSKRK